VISPSSAPELASARSKGCRVKQAEEDVDVGADIAVIVIVDGTHVECGAELNARGLAEYPVVAPDEAAEPFRQWVDDTRWWQCGRYDDQRAVAAVLGWGVLPGQPGSAECRLQDLVQLSMQVEADVVVALRAGEADDVDTEQTADLALSRQARRGGAHAAHLRPVLVRSPPRVDLGPGP